MILEVGEGFPSLIFTDFIEKRLQIAFPPPHLSMQLHYGNEDGGVVAMSGSGTPRASQVSGG